MEVQYTDDKRKLFSKKGSRNSSSRRAAAAEGGGGGAALLRKSASAREVGRDRSSFSNRCANVAKEQRARFYIVRRCVTMLVCWRDYP